MRLVLATRNAHKAREFATLLAPHDVLALAEDVVLPPETGRTFAENALGKARAAAHATGLPVIADDSGIEADALGGAPGVRSARFAGERATDAENLDRLVREVPPGTGLAYVCALAHVVVDGDGTAHEHVVEGRCTGVMAEAPRGAGGFGYDPVFVPDDQEGREDEDGQGRRRTMAELAPAEKAEISHRGRAARALLAWLPPA